MTSIIDRQKDPRALNLLKAVGQAYIDIKFWMRLSIWIGVVIPVLTSIYANIVDIKIYAALIGVISTIVIEVIAIKIKNDKEIAAKIQEMFDVYVFEIEWSKNICGSEVDENIITEKSKRYKGDVDYCWYTRKAAEFSHPQSIALCQQQNSCWDSDLRKKILFLVMFCVSLFCVALLFFTTFTNPTFNDFFLNTISPLLPVFIFYFKFYFENKDSILESDRLKNINADFLDLLTQEKISNKKVVDHIRKMQDLIFMYRRSVRPISGAFKKVYKSSFENSSDSRVDVFISRYLRNRPQ